MKLMKKLLVLPFFIILFLLFGCYGVQSRGECGQYGNPTSRMDCFHRAAISSAYADGYNDATASCDEIRNIGNENPGTDLANTGEVQRNICFYDIAKIFASKAEGVGGSRTSVAMGLCGEIKETSTSGMLGSPVTQNLCEEQVARLESINPGNYYSNPNNLCNNIAFVLLPLFAAVALRIGRP